LIGIDQRFPIKTGLRFLFSDRSAIEKPLPELICRRNVKSIPDFFSKSISDFRIKIDPRFLFSDRSPIFYFQIDPRFLFSDRSPIFF